MKSPEIDEKTLLKAKVLEEVNELRQRWGAEPIDQLPVGIRWSGESCVIARALGGGVGVSFTGAVCRRTLDADGYGRPELVAMLSSGATRFIQLFDEGQFPELTAIAPTTMPPT